MSKELIKPQQYRKAETLLSEEPLELNSEQKKLLADLFEDVEKFIKGKLIKGTVKNVSSDGVLVDIGYKSDGLIPTYEFSKHEIKEIKPGSEIEVMLDELENYDGSVMLSYEKAKTIKAWDRILKLHEDGKAVEGTVTNKVKGGLSVDIGIQAFLPGSQVDVQRITDFDQFVGQTVNAYIIKINQKRGNVIISRRKYINELRSESRKKVLDKLDIGEVLQGVVKNITNYGAFVDVGGLDGLLHITDMTWGRISHPSELLKIGETITVKVLSFDKENEKISLGLKQLTENPWENIPEDIKIGSTIKGKISSITDYGVFVEVAPGVEGLIHISEISWTNRITDIQKHYKVGDKIEALVVTLDKENRRMSLSVKQLEQNPWEKITKQYKVGEKIKGKISNITEFGIFIQLEPGIDGLVHISDFSWTEHIEHPSDRYKKGDEVEAVIIGINEDTKKISLGVKQLTPNPWDEIEDTYPVGSIIDGTVSKITKFGAFIKLPSGIEGLLHSSELTSQEKDKKLKAGDTAKFKVIKSNKEERKIGLTLRIDQEISEPRDRSKFKKEKTFKKREKSTSEQPKSQLQIELEKLREKDNKK